MRGVGSSVDVGQGLDIRKHLGLGVAGLPQVAHIVDLARSSHKPPAAGVSVSEAAELSEEDRLIKDVPAAIPIGCPSRSGNQYLDVGLNHAVASRGGLLQPVPDAVTPWPDALSSALRVRATVYLSL